MNKAILLAVTFIAGFGTAKFFSDDRWDAYVYENKHDLSRHVFLGSHKDLYACQAAAQNMMAYMGWMEAGDYECGLNCKPSEYGMQTCEVTSR